MPTACRSRPLLYKSFLKKQQPTLSGKLLFLAQKEGFEPSRRFIDTLLP